MIKKNQTSKLRFLYLIFLSTLLIGTVNFINSFNGLYLQNSSSILGNTDIILTRGSVDEFYNMHFKSDLENVLESELKGIQYFPRLYSIGKTGIYNPRYLNPSQNLVVCGINSTQEKEAQANYLKKDLAAQSILNLFKNQNQLSIENKMGYLWICNDALEPTQNYFQETIPFGKCILTRTMALGLNASVGQKYEFQMVTGNFFLTVMAIVENDGRFPNTATGLIITDLDWLQYVLQIPGQINTLSGIFDQPEQYYNIANIQSTLDNLNQITQKILKITDDDYSILYPRLLNLQMSESQIVGLYQGLEILLIFIVLIVIIAYFYSTQMEIQDTPKSKNSDEYHPKSKKELYSILFLYLGKNIAFPALIGVILGHIISVFLFAFHITLVNILYSAFFLLVLLIICSIKLYFELKEKFPVYFIGRKHKITNPLQRIHSYRRNFLFLIIGSVFTILSIGLLTLLPSIIVIPDSFVLMIFLGILSAGIFVGLILVFFSIFPTIEKLLSYSISIICQKGRRKEKMDQKFHIQYEKPIFIIPLILFSLLFSLLGFQQLKNQNQVNEILFNQGADLIVTNLGNLENNNYIDQGFVQKLGNYSLIQNVAPVYLSFQSNLALENAQSYSLDFTSLDFSQKGNIVKNYTRVGDLGDWDNMNVGLIGINSNFFEIIDIDLAQWESKSNSNKTAFSQLFEESTTQNNSDSINCVISHRIASYLHFSTLNTFLWLKVYSGSNNQILNEVLLNVVGISTGIPGFDNFYTENPFSNPMPAIMVSNSNYYKIMNYTNEMLNNIPIDHIFIDFKLDTLQDAENSNNSVLLNQFIQEIYLDFRKDYNFQIIEPIAKIEYVLQGNERIDRYFMIFQWGGIISTLFLSISVNIKNKKFISNDDCSILNYLMHNLLLLFFAMIIGLSFILLIFYLLANLIQIPIKLPIDMKDFGIMYAILFLLYSIKIR